MPITEDQLLGTKELIALEEAYGAHNYHPLDVVIERAAGAWVYDVEGKRYLDCLAAYSAVNQGHCHPRILEALVEQAKKVTLTSRAFRNAQLPLLYKELHDLTGMEMTLLMNSGAEAVETAVKAARKWGYTKKGIAAGQAEIIVCAGNFHGRTVTVVSFSSDEQYREGFGPFTPGFRIIPFGDAKALRAAITPNTCAFLVEPIQGEAGIVIPPDGFLREAAAICREKRVLLMVDEIQSGLGRTGKLFAYMHEGIRPDVLIIGRHWPEGITRCRRCCVEGDSGRIRAGRSRKHVWRESTGVRGGAGVAASADRRETGGAVGGAGRVFPGEIADVAQPSSERGTRAGLWIGIELTTEARKYCEALKEEGILCKETHSHIIRIAPPLVIQREEIDWAFERIRKVLE